MTSLLRATTLALLLATGPALLAHHSFAAEYDDKAPVKVTGTVTKVEWTNPHIWFFVDVKDAQGRITSWGFSGGPPRRSAAPPARSRATTRGGTRSAPPPPRPR